MSKKPTLKSQMKTFDEVSADVSFPQNEENILEFWDKNQSFEKTLEESKGKPFFSFNDGPPFANGLPHYGHILPGTLKDIVPRYWTMKGYHVPRYFGWDCHGVPVEYEINKNLNITSAAQVHEMGIAKYNEACRSIVLKYTAEWEKTIRRTGRWVDIKNGYRTMDLAFMQSVWWNFKQLWDKGLIYKGYKVVPFSLGLSTSLSNFEASQNYKMVQDPAITARFRVEDAESTFLLAWTTTPWTLPSNLALAVGSDLTYVAVRHPKTKEKYVLAENLMPAFADELSENDEFDVVERFLGSDLKGWRYQPLFPYFQKYQKPQEGFNAAFTVVTSDHVTTESGTGIVHMAPAFGEDDFRVCKRAGLPIVNPVDDDGKFTSEAKDYVGLGVKESDKKIISDLRNQGDLFRHDTLDHSYPHCERTDSPLIYKAISSWFVNVEKIKDSLVANNKKTHWVPEHLRDGRFGNWLENARDWAISRNRFWGTPLPVWENSEGEQVCVGSVEELEKLTGKSYQDIHIHFLEDAEIPSPTGKSPLKRTPGVLDCWFESGSMPSAQWGYPYNEEKKGNFEQGFPADFVAEGLDHTRGWFYTLMVIATGVWNKPAFKNVIVNGIVLAEDGKKMSKRLKNYPDPRHVLDEYGADAMRLYLIDSPAVKAQDLKFSEKGLREVVRRILLRWWNAYSFFVSYVNLDSYQPVGLDCESPNILDRWILSRLNSLTDLVNREMDTFHLYSVVPAVSEFIEELTNTYIRFNRRVFWKEGLPKEKQAAYETLYTVLITLSKLMAPFCPFITETMYQNLKRSLGSPKDTVHLESYPVYDAGMVNPLLEKSVGLMMELCVMGRHLREQLKIKAKIPLKSMRIYHREKAVLNELKKLEPFFVDELNVRDVEYDANEDGVVQISAKPNFPKLGPRLGKDIKPVTKAIGQLNLDQINSLENGEQLEVCGYKLDKEDVEIRRKPKVESQSFMTGRSISISLDSSLDSDQLAEGLMREVLRRVQIARKNANLNLDDRIVLSLTCDEQTKNAVLSHQKYLVREALVDTISFAEDANGAYHERFEIEGKPITVAFTVV